MINVLELDELDSCKSKQENEIRILQGSNLRNDIAAERMNQNSRLFRTKDGTPIKILDLD